ncbi:MAG: DUF4982 domain-containing protein [Melioribacteraceae bacterium]|nr:DUF4982 domain-containing protein [Melioribacteraceae bacterium]
MLKNVHTLIPIFLLLINVQSFSQSQQKYALDNPRIVESINNDWTFNYFPQHKFDDNVSSINYNDSTWDTIALPHTWSTFETTGEVHPFIRNASERDDPYWWKGWGWYRKKIQIDKSLSEKKVFVEFDGVQKYSRLYVNGNYVGEHKGGFTSFYFDISEYIKYGEENLLSMAVSNRRDDKFGGIPPMTAGNWNVYGGIYRDARIVVTNNIYIPYQGSAEHEGGTFITTPIVDSTKAVVDINAFIKNESEKQKSIQVYAYILDSEFFVIDTIYRDYDLPNSKISKINIKSNEILNPKLWSNLTPHLYNLVIELRSDGTIIDLYHSTFGIRWFEWNYETNRLLVNGKQIHIHGTNRHQEYPWLGDAMPKWIHRNEMYEIRHDLGHNFMRTGHYPNDPLIYDLTDTLGIITAEEVPNIKSIDFGEEIQEANVREMIRRDRNHPSIFFWSVGNETDDAADSKWAWEEDTTRILHERKTENYGEYVTHNAKNLDMENLLRVTVRGWYNKDVRDLEPVNTKEKPKSGQSAGTEEWQHKMARVKDASIRGRIDENVVAWLYADHGADREYENVPLKHINPKGWTDLYRIPKYMYYLWQANYSTKSMIFIQPHNWQKKYIGQKKNFQVDSNCEEVELFVNGKSQGALHPNSENFHTVEFQNILVEEGELKAVARSGEESIEYKIQMAGEPKKLVLSTKQPQINAGRDGISVIRVDAVDAQNNPVLATNPTLHWSVEGPAELITPEIYMTDIDKNWAMDGVMYTYLPITTIIRSTDEEGEIKVKVSADGLTGDEITVLSTRPKKDKSLITQVRLSDKNRIGVIKDEGFIPSVEYIREIEDIINNQIFNADNSKEYQKQISKFILKNNKSVYKKSFAFKRLENEFGIYLVKMNGELVADDYNFIIKKYNDARTLDEIIELKNFHPKYEELLKKNYAERFIVNSEILDLEEEKDFINSIPGDSRLNRFKKIKNGEGKITRNNALHWYDVEAKNIEELIELNFPSFNLLQSNDKNRVIEFIDRINPFVENEDVESNFPTYKIEEGEPILIPDPKLILGQLNE